MWLFPTVHYGLVSLHVQGRRLTDTTLPSGLVYQYAEGENGLLCNGALGKGSGTIPGPAESS